MIWEEREVIEAALAMPRFMVDNWTNTSSYIMREHLEVRTEHWRPLAVAIEALRESRKPKPKWRVDPEQPNRIIGPDGASMLCYMNGATSALTGRIGAQLLNKADPAE